ncbi:hypothetical protein GCM10010872_38140 [Dyella flava]|nr:hypothetical protein GCM10010872_38140 [Dyella flava]
MGVLRTRLGRPRIARGRRVCRKNLLVLSESADSGWTITHLGLDVARSVQRWSKGIAPGRGHVGVRVL